MDKRFFNIFNLTEDEAIAILDTPQDQVSEDDSRYIAASHLVNFPTEPCDQCFNAEQYKKMILHWITASCDGSQWRL